MAGETNYVLIWFIYLTSGAVFYLVFWKFTALLWRLPAWLARAFMAALILTPVLPRGEQGTAAPALMAAALDAIAGDPAATARGLAALATGMIAAMLVALTLFLGLFASRRRSGGLRSPKSSGKAPRAAETE